MFRRTGRGSPASGKGAKRSRGCLLRIPFASLLWYGAAKTAGIPLGFSAAPERHAGSLGRFLKVDAGNIDRASKGVFVGSLNVFRPFRPRALGTENDRTRSAPASVQPLCRALEDADVLSMFAPDDWRRGGLRNWSRSIKAHQKLALSATALDWRSQCLGVPGPTLDSDWGADRAPKGAAPLDPTPRQTPDKCP